MPTRTVTLYIDYSYAYLAKEPAYRLERETGVAIDWLPYILDIPPTSAAPRSTPRVGSWSRTATPTSGAA